MDDNMVVTSVTKIILVIFTVQSSVHFCLSPYSDFYIRGTTFGITIGILIFIRKTPLKL